MNGTATATALTGEADELVRRARSAFDTVPVMRLTRPQFRRLMDVDRSIVDVVIARLLESRYLVEGADGRLGRWPHLGDAARDRSET